MVKYILILVSGVIMTPLPGAAQEYNQTDTNGKRHGIWQKYFEGTRQLRYSGTFNHGKEVGTFKFYDKNGGHPTAIKIYTHGTDLLDLTYYTRAGKKISEGKMKERSKEGAWIYYHKDGTSIMAREFYKNNALEGRRTVYFDSGQKAQETQYQKGLRQGPDLYYNENAVLLKKIYFKDDKLEGPAQFYNVDGSLLREGQYKNNRKDGIWKYYKNGKVEKTVKFPQNKIGVE